MGETPYRELRSDRDYVDAFIEDHSLPLLTSEQELELGHLVQAGLGAESRLHIQYYQSEKARHKDESLVEAGTLARSHFFHANLRLVASVAKSYENHPLGRKYGLRDMFNEGVIGLNHAIKRFDPSRKLKFSTSAVWWIRHYITREFSDHAETVHIPSGRQPVLRRLADLEELHLEDDEIMELLELGNRKELAELRTINRWRYNMVSLDSPISQNDSDATAIHEILADPLSQAEFERVDEEGADSEKALFSEATGRLIERLRPLLSKKEVRFIEHLSEGKSDETERRALSRLHHLLSHPAVQAEVFKTWPKGEQDKGWQDEAACAGHAEIYTKDSRLSTEELEKLQRVCGGCVVRQECEAAFLKLKPERGRWIDGRSGAEFRAPKKKRKSDQQQLRSDVY